MREHEVQPDDWPLPEHGSPVWVTVSSYSTGYLRKVVGSTGSQTAEHLLHWALEQVIGRGISLEWEKVACELISKALTVVKKRDAEELELEPMFQGEGEIGPVSLSNLISTNILHTGEMRLTADEIHTLCTMDVGEEMTTGGGAFASTTFRRII